jgi:hypothetical protein
MSDVPPPTNAFEKMMAAARGATTPSPAAVAADEDEDDDPVLTAVLYEARLEHADESEPLWHVPYFGQIVRVGTAEAIFAKRKREHETAAAREDKDLGLLAVIDRFGPEAMAWRIVSFKSGPRTAMQAWANAEEIELINQNGGMLRDMDAKLTQTLNLTKGGKGDARAWWAGIDARRRRALNRFKAAMAKYVAEHDSALVPRDYVDEDDGYPLGTQLSNFRQGSMWKGLSEEKEIIAWAEALPKWEWNGRETDQWRQGLAQRNQERSREAFTKFKAAMEKYVEKHDSALVPFKYVDDDGYRLGEALKNFRKGVMWKGTPWEDEVKAWAKALPNWHWDARKSDAFHENCSQRAKKRCMDELRAELQRARPIAVPFEKSNKRRIEMYAASTNFSGKKGNAVLYMQSEDGKTIRRVQPNGSMGNRFIVGPVVDPSATPEAGPSDLNAYVSDSESESG